MCTESSCKLLRQVISRSYTPSSRNVLVFVTLLLSARGLPAQERSGMRWLDVDFPHDSPIGVVSFSLGDSTATVKGVSLALDLHTSLALRNWSGKRVRGLTLRVEAQDLTPAGKASVTVPSLNVLPGETFPIRIDLELLRPFNSTKSGGALVQVTLDCVLFDDLSSYGPDNLRSKRTLLVYELEARRDRQYFRKLIENGQTAKLREEMNFGLPDVRVPQLAFELLRNAADNDHRSRPVTVSFVAFPHSPVEVMNGAAEVYRNELHMPHVDVRNRTSKTLQSIEVGWILQGDGGRNFVAGSLPKQIEIGPIQQGTVQESGVLRFSHPSGRPVTVDGVMAFIGSVQFNDGNLWIPSRTDISDAELDPALKRAIANSPEQQRLLQIYRRQGLAGLTLELRRTMN
jgi:hypothetical protein